MAGWQTAYMLKYKYHRNKLVLHWTQKELTNWLLDHYQLCLKELLSCQSDILGLISSFYNNSSHIFKKPSAHSLIVFGRYTVLVKR